MGKETAEQKLLNIIEATEAAESGTASDQSGQGAQPNPTAQEVAASVKGAGVSFALPSFIGDLLSIFSGGKSSADRAPAQFGLGTINRFLALGIVVLAIFMVVDFMNGMKFANKELEFDVDLNVADRNDDFLPKIKEVAEYLLVIAQRNIFQPFEKDEPVELANVPEEVKIIQERTKDLKLVGVSWLDTPESASALIENKESGMTYFLRAGEKVNNVVVKEIYAESVVLTAEGEEVELNL